MRAPLTPPRPPHAGPNLVLQALTFKLASSWGGALQGCPLPFSAPSRGATGARGVAWPAGPHGLGRSCAGSQTSATPLCSPAGQVRLARCRHVGPSGPPLFSICPAPRPPASLPRFRSPARTERGGLSLRPLPRPQMPILFLQRGNSTWLSLEAGFTASCAVGVGPPALGQRSSCSFSSQRQGRRPASAPR